MLIWKSSVFVALLVGSVVRTERCTKGICRKVRCEIVREKDCKKNEVYNPKGATCGCCPACIPKKDPQCEPDICDIVDCRNVRKEDCKANEIYDINGGYCGCCAACIPNPECEPDICNRVDCRNVRKEDCKANEIYDEKGGYCGCCAACIPKPGGVQISEGHHKCRSCSIVRCIPVQKEDCKPNQRYEPSDGICKCCGFCITLLGPGDACEPKFRGGSQPPEECGEGLTCRRNIDTGIYTCQYGRILPLDS